MAPGAARFFVALQATAAVLASVVLGLATGSIAPALICFAVCCSALSGVALVVQNSEHLPRGRRMDRWELYAHVLTLLSVVTAGVAVTVDALATQHKPAVPLDVAAVILATLSGALGVSAFLRR